MPGNYRAAVAVLQAAFYSAAVWQAQKKRAEDMIVEEDKIDGMELVEAKVFK